MPTSTPNPRHRLHRPSWTRWHVSQRAEPDVVARRLPIQPRTPPTGIGPRKIGSKHAVEYANRRPGRASQARNSWVPPPESARISTAASHRPGLGQREPGDLDVIARRVRAGVARPEHDGQRLPGPLGAVIGEDGQRMQAIGPLSRRPGLLFLRARGHDRRVDVDRDQPAARRGHGVAGQLPRPAPARRTGPNSATVTIANGDLWDTIPMPDLNLVPSEYVELVEQLARVQAEVVRRRTARLEAGSGGLRT